MNYGDSWNIRISEIQIGDVIKSNYTNTRYTVCWLPAIPSKGTHSYALIRTDGMGYCYLSNTLDELREEIYRSGEEHFLIADGEEILIEGV